MMRSVAYDEELAGRIRALLADRTDVEEKKMFGGLSFMVAGQMCCGVLKNDLVARIEPAEFDELVAQAHVRPFDFGGRVSQGMVYVDSAGPGRSRGPADVGGAWYGIHRGPPGWGQAPQTWVASLKRWIGERSRIRARVTRYSTCMVCV